MSKRQSSNATGERVPTRLTPPFDPANVRHRVRALVDPSGCSRIGLVAGAGAAGSPRYAERPRASHDEHIVGSAGSSWDVACRSDLPWLSRHTVVKPRSPRPTYSARSSNARAR
jgi:hypothetical protein